MKHWTGCNDHALNPHWPPHVVQYMCTQINLDLPPPISKRALLPAPSRRHITKALSGLGFQGSLTGAQGAGQGGEAAPWDGLTSHPLGQ